MEIDYRKERGIEFYNLDTIGGLDYRFENLENQKSKSYSLLRPIIIPEIIKEDNQFDSRFSIGYLNPNYDFLPSDLYFHYICLKSVVIQKYQEKTGRRVIEKHKAQIRFNVYSKDFLKSKYLSLDVSLNYYSKIPNTNLICDTINWVNLYIHKENELDNLDQSFPILETQKYLKEKTEGILYNKPIILRTISDLKFEYFNNGRYRPRREDDHFWEEIEISNIPRNKYLKKLIKKSLIDSGYEKVEVKDEKKKNELLIFKTKTHTMGNVFWSRSQEELKPELLNELLDILKIGMHMNYNELECLFGMIQK